MIKFKVGNIVICKQFTEKKGSITPDSMIAADALYLRNNKIKMKIICENEDSYLCRYSFKRTKGTFYFKANELQHYIITNWELKTK